MTREFKRATAGFDVGESPTDGQQSKNNTHLWVGGVVVGGWVGRVGWVGWGGGGGGSTFESIVHTRLFLPLS